MFTIKKNKMKALLLLVFISQFYAAHSQNIYVTTENHYNVTTVSTSIDCLSGLCTLSLNEFRTQLMGIGYKDYGTQGEGIMLVKDAPDNLWRVSISVVHNGIMVLYYKHDNSLSYHFTDDLIDSLKKYYIRTIKQDDGQYCPQYVVAYKNGLSFTYTVCRSEQSEAIIVIKHQD